MNPGKFLGHPKLPKYLNKQGRNLLVYTDQAISRDPKNAGWVVPSGVPIRVATHHDRYQGKRVKRGLFRSSSGREINADVNGSYNILRKAVPAVFAQGIAHLKLHPIVLSLPDRRQDRRKQSPTPLAKAKLWHACPCWGVLYHMYWA